jgi:ribosomal protein S1
MSETTFRGTVTFVQYEKHFATIDYKHNGKPKTVNFKTKAATPGGRQHHFRIGDEVSFQLKLSDRGDRMTAHAVKFHFNPKLEKLVQKAQHENRFTGYLKKVDDELFIKEIETYLFFPLSVSPWETHPGEQSFNTEVSFKLTNLDKQPRVGAELFFQVFIPEYRQAEQLMQQKTPVPATVTKVSPYAIYVELLGGKIQSKISLPADGLEAVQPDDQIQVIITFVSPHKIVVEKILD